MGEARMWPWARIRDHGSNGTCVHDRVGGGFVHSNFEDHLTPDEDVMQPTLDAKGKPVEIVGGPFAQSVVDGRPGSLTDTTPNGTLLRDRIEDGFGNGGARNRRGGNGTTLLDRVDEDFGGGGVVTQRLGEPHGKVWRTPNTFGAAVKGQSPQGTSWSTPNGTALSSGSAERADGESMTHWTMRQRRDLFESPHIYAVVEGTDEEDAFQHGREGEAVPLWEIAPPLPVLNELRWKESGRVIALRLERDWSEAFFGGYGRWEPGDDAGIVLRVAEFLSRERRARTQSGVAVDTSTVTQAQQQRAQLILRSLTDPDEMLDADQGDGIGRVDLGDDPEFTKVCVRAVAIMLLEEQPRDAVAVLELPKAAGSDLRRFLFFGARL